MRKIRKEDQVIVITGKYKGKTGRVMRVVDEGRKLFVEGVNLIKKHQKPNPNKEQPGQIVQREAKIDASNVAIYNTTTAKADRVGFKMVDGKKRRFFKKTGELIDL